MNKIKPQQSFCAGSFHNILLVVDSRQLGRFHRCAFQKPCFAGVASLGLAEIVHVFSDLVVVNEVAFVALQV